MLLYDIPYIILIYFTYFNLYIYYIIIGYYKLLYPKLLNVILP
jgi:hypothetical protein